MATRLSRSRTDRVLGGVCGGLARYLALDPTLIRAFFVLFTLADGIGVLLYMLLWILLPLEGQESAPIEGRVSQGAQEIAQRAGEIGREVGNLPAQGAHAVTWVGAGLVFAGAYLLLRNLDFPWLAWLNSDVLWPILLIVAGIVVLLRRGRVGSE